jgi:hypothetical protein
MYVFHLLVSRNRRCSFFSVQNHVRVIFEGILLLKVHYRLCEGILHEDPLYSVEDLYGGSLVISTKKKGCSLAQILFVLRLLVEESQTSPFHSRNGSQICLQSTKRSFFRIHRERCSPRILFFFFVRRSWIRDALKSQRYFRRFSVTGFKTLTWWYWVLKSISICYALWFLDFVNIMIPKWKTFSWTISFEFWLTLDRELKSNTSSKLTWSSFLFLYFFFFLKRRRKFMFFCWKTARLVLSCCALCQSHQV